MGQFNLMKISESEKEPDKLQTVFEGPSSGNIPEQLTCWSALLVAIPFGADKDREQEIAPTENFDYFIAGEKALPLDAGRVSVRAVQRKGRQAIVQKAM